jgi:hypothetical protein
MDTSDQIASLIERVRTFPNSLARNKCMSHLHDALVWAEKLAPMQNTDAEPKANAECICPVGGRRRDCPVHQQP